MTELPIKRKRGRPQKVKTFSENAPVVTEKELVGKFHHELPPPEPTLPPSPREFPPVGGDIHDPIRVLRLAYAQMTIEKLRSQQTSYRLSFDNQIKELTARRTTTLAQLQQELALADENYRAIQREIEQVHGISVQSYTFNPESGTLNKLVDTTKMPGGDGGNTSTVSQ